MRGRFARVLGQTVREGHSQQTPNAERRTPNIELALARNAPHQFADGRIRPVADQTLFESPGVSVRQCAKFLREVCEVAENSGEGGMARLRRE